MTTEQAIKRIEDTKSEIKKKISGLPPLMRDRTSMNSIVQALDMAASALREQENNRWVSVSERFPTKEDADAHGMVLTCNAEGFIDSLPYPFVKARCDRYTYWKPNTMPQKEG